MMKCSLFIRGTALLGCLVCLVFSAPAPASAGGVYLVKSGDTLSRISRRFGVDAESVRALNHLETADISPGDRIRIPDKKPKPAVRAAANRQPVAVPDPVLPTAASNQDRPVENTPRREVSVDRVLQAVCRDETVYHSVVKGDTLFAIANRYATEIDALLQLNGLKKNARLSVGQKLLVRKSGPRSHTVARGETLVRIASRYKVSADEIARLNRLNGNKIAAGQRLLIEPCDPYAVAGSAPPALGGPDAAERETGGLSAAIADTGSRSTLAADSGVSASAAVITQRVIDLAKSMLNVPYRFGGSSMRGIDCSAFVQRVFGLLDVQIPRTAREQYAVGARIGRDDVRIGDLVFFRTDASYPSHVGIYLGENLFIHASSMVRRVAIDSIDLPYYSKRFIGARRLVLDGGPAVASAP
jgi:cell wall-associated NlpC family hydrolase